MTSPSKQIPRHTPSQKNGALGISVSHVESVVEELSCDFNVFVMDID